MSSLEKEKDKAGTNEFPWLELASWILMRLKGLMFKDDGTKRRSIFIQKARLLVFAYDLFRKIQEILKKRKMSQLIQQ